MFNSTLFASVVMSMIISLCACSSDTGSDIPHQYAASLESPEHPISNDELSNSNETAVADDVATRFEYLRIKHHMVECEGFQVSHCLLVQKQGSNEWTYFYEHIDGFYYQWGYDYEILVQVKLTDHEIADTSEQRYSLMQVISQSQHNFDVSFNYISRNLHERINEIAPAKFSLLEGKAFNCTDQSCDALRSAITQQHSVVLLFQHRAVSTEPLVLSAVVCSDSESSFARSCL